ncbi:MAG: type IV pilus modification protein PilV [Pseudomonas sp.]|uniref:type IV pilus modification protein PilV n=1 Tax=Pseudomonas sp. TaxID=306 RepID=UPI0030F285FD
MRTRAKGFTLIEVLIALVILAIGLLGMSSLMMTSMQSSQSAYLRSQASLLAYDLTERMRANVDRATGSNDYQISAGTTSVTNPGCTGGLCTPTQQAQLDLSEWRAALTGSIPGSTASVVRANQNEYTITIAWEESSALQGNTGTSNFVLKVNL